MHTLKRNLLAAVALVGFATASLGQTKYGFGTPATDADVALGIWTSMRPEKACPPVEVR